MTCNANQPESTAATEYVPLACALACSNRLVGGSVPGASIICQQLVAVIHHSMMASRLGSIEWVVAGTAEHNACDYYRTRCWQDTWDGGYPEGQRCHICIAYVLARLQMHTTNFAE
jgi:hypothetical protein